MKKSVRINLTCFLLAASGSIYAQQGPVSAGGEAFGSGILLSYSIGQTDYIQVNGTEGSINEGLQQPYELFLVSAINEKSSGVKVHMYPNPASEMITLETDQVGQKNFAYILEDASGKKLSVEKITAALTQIPLTEFNKGIYFLKVVSDNSQITIYKIIKN